MHSNKRIILTAFCIVVFLFGAGVVFLFQNLSHQGLMFPPYSSLSSEPTGLRGLYESLVRLGTSKVERSFVPLHKMDETTGCTHIVAGMPINALNLLPKHVYASLDSSVKNGAKLVIANPTPTGFFNSIMLDAQDSNSHKSNQHSQDSTGEPVDNAGVPGIDSGDTGKGVSQLSERDSLAQENIKKTFMDAIMQNMINVYEQWELSMHVLPFAKDSTGKRRSFAWAYSTNPDYTDSVRWLSPWYFELDTIDWKVLYARDDKPVIISRSYGEGEIILSTDSYLFTNEALAYDPAPGLLHYLTGTKERIVFHETQLGMVKEKNLFALLNRYHLLGFLIAVFVLLLLYIWKSAFPLITLRERNSGETILQDEQAEASGMYNLIVGALQKKDIIRECVEQWKSGSHLPKRVTELKARELYDADEKLKTVEGLKPGLVERYNHITKVLNKTSGV
ncbi:MAG: hypothetical protein HQK83_15205 [Fibrobacteria bacterium]|nr:hypothetical protein [Fibrobacteria bacterium]